MIRRSFIQVICLLVFLMLSSNISAEHTWGSYHWARTTASFDLKVVDSVTSDWDGELVESLSRWSLSTVLNANIDSSKDDRKTRRRCSMVVGQMRVCNHAYGNNGWLGLATIGIDSNGHIDRGTAKMNDSYASYWAVEGEKNHVMCQEIGHVFGLGHTSEDGSSQQTCMDYSTDPLSQWPNDHDYELLEEIYSHLDTYDSYANDSGGGSDSGACNAPPGKGCNKNGSGVPPMGVRVNKGRSHEIWVAPRAGGGLWVHHIRLVPEGY